MAVIKKYINFRVTTEEHRAFQALVDRLKKPLGTWAREVLLREMGLNPKLKDLLGAEVPGSPIEITEPVPAPPTPEPASDTEIPASIEKLSGTEPWLSEPEEILPQPTMSISSTTNEAAKMDTPPKAIPAIERMYQIILKRDGKKAADAWRALRDPVKPNIPEHLKAFYKNLVTTQGQEKADFWLLTQKR